MRGIKRNLEAKLFHLLEQFPAVVILGARQVGKTTLCREMFPNWGYYDLENPNDFERIQHDPTFFFQQHSHSIILDEAQILPLLFSTLRGVIDQDRARKGRFLITGSSSPELLNHISESLAGRVAIVELGTLKANEYYNNSLSSFYDLFRDKINKRNLVEGPAPLSNKNMQMIWLRGGYPEPVLTAGNDFFNQWMENYRNTYINRDVARLFPRLNKLAFQRFLTILSKLSGTLINKSDVGRTIEISESSVREYLSIIEGTFIWRSLSSYKKYSKVSFKDA